MGQLVDGDDGIPVEEVGKWATGKHVSLCRYIDISKAVRGKWLGPGKGGATYIDLFCGPGRSRIRRTGEYVDGSCVAAWKESVRTNTPFTQVFIADADGQRRAYAAHRLKNLGAPVIEIDGDAVAAARRLSDRLSPQGLHFAFLDPYNLAAFDFSVVELLSRFRYIDMLVHISKMDLQRNLGLNIRLQQSAFDKFAPGWRDVVNLHQNHAAIRRAVFDYWKSKITALGIYPSVDMELITGEQGQHLYWLTLAARHDLAHRFWKIASNKQVQGDLFD